MRRYLIICIVGLILWFSCGGDTEAPSVSITSPSSGSSVNGTVNVIIQVTDNEVLESVEVYIDDFLVAAITSEPYEYSWETDTIRDSTYHEIYAKAYDTAGNEGVSPTITVMVDNSLCDPLEILIWLFDPDDRFYDAEVGDSIDCAYWIEQCFTSCDRDFDKSTDLPVDLDEYDVIFITLGWYREC